MARSTESIGGLLRRAERRAGRPFRGLNAVWMRGDDLRRAGMRVTREEARDTLWVWQASFGDDAGVRLFFGRTPEAAIMAAIDRP